MLDEAPSTGEDCLVSRKLCLYRIRQFLSIDFALYMYLLLPCSITVNPSYKLVMSRYIESGEDRSQAYSLQPRKHGMYENPETCREITFSPKRDSAYYVL